MGKADIAGTIDLPPLEGMAAALYDDMHRIAQRERRRAGLPETWQTTAVLHEAYLKLYRKTDWESREHFLGTAAKAMRHVLINAARARLTGKRGAGNAPLRIEAAGEGPALAEDMDIVRLGEALRALEAIDPDLAKLVDCRFFAGLDERETARVLGVTDRTVRRWWVQARAWLHREMAEE